MDLQPFVDTLPASGEMPFAQWKQSLAAANLRMGNRAFLALKKRGDLVMRIDADQGLVVSRGQVG